MTPMIACISDSELGIDREPERSSPSLFVDPFTGDHLCGTCGDDGSVAHMSLGDGVTCTVTESQQAKCWGRNEHGQLGQGDQHFIGDDELPSAIGFIDLGGPVEEIHTNGDQTFARLTHGVVRAWGSNAAFELGLGHTEPLGDDETPATAGAAVDLTLGGPAAQIVVGADFACARLTGGAVQCWGSNDLGQLGYGQIQIVGDDETPADVGDVALVGPAQSLSAGAHHVCALLDDGRVQCWGANDFGQLGYATTEDVGDDETPASMGTVALGGTVVEVQAGGHHTCARRSSGAIVCWGQGLYGQLGYGDTGDIGDDERPVAAGAVPLGGVAIDLAAGEQHTCAVLDDGSLRCWGAGGSGQLGYGNTLSVGGAQTPAEVGGVDLGVHQVVSVYAGATASSTCVRLNSGGLRCWGDNDVGQLGYGHTDSLGDAPTEGPGYLDDILVIDSADG
ncbi:MAG: hypothetical protein AAGF11_31805 [Myxococcota bacterium]